MLPKGSLQQLLLLAVVVGSGCWQWLWFVVVVVVVVCAKLVPNTMALKVILVFELFLVFPRTNAVGGLAENKGSLLAFFAHRNLFALKRMLLAMFFYASSAKALLVVFRGSSPSFLFG